jgi:hypothetical protein
MIMLYPALIEQGLTDLGFTNNLLIPNSYKKIKIKHWSRLDRLARG